MKRKICKLSAIVIFSGILLSLNSCWDEIPYRDAEYPEQTIYMTTAYYNNRQLIIDDINRIRGTLPIEGNPYKYFVDLSKRELQVPLSAYRAGINNKGGFTVNINVNTNIIETINANREVKYLFIPADKYSLVNSVEMKDGEELAKFNLIVDLDFLRNNYPTEIFALGVEISSTERERNENLSTTAVIIHSKIVKPAANFTFEIDESNNKSVTFMNSSSMSESYVWNFGDGSATSNVLSPSHVYSAPGTYTVTLTATGITGDEDKSVKTVDITIE